MSSRSSGFTLVELMLAIVVVALLTAIAVPVYSGHMERVRQAQAVADLRRLEADLQRYRSNNNRWPDALTDLPGSVPADPWGRPYRYLNIESGGPGVNGMVRKDKNLVPLNTDFDLYSSGPDGDSRPPLTAKPSRDDIVRANNGGFVGPAAEY